MVSIERAKVSDVIAIHAINIECLPENYTVDYIAQRLLTFPTLCYVGRVDGNVVGYLFSEVRDERNIAMLTSIAVRRKYRGLGVARSMIEQMLIAAGEWRGCKLSRLCVREENTVAKRLYESLGYCEIDYSSRFYTDGMGYEMERKI